MEQLVDNYMKHGAADISYIRIVRRVIKGHDGFDAQFVVDVRPIGMTDQKVSEETLAIAKYNAELVQKTKAAGKSTIRLRLKHSVPSIIEHPCGNKTVELIRDCLLYTSDAA